MAKSSAKALERLRNGEAEAQSAFWKKQTPLVYAVCAHVLGEGANAREVTDEVMIDFLFRFVHRVRDENRVEAYLRLMAARRAVRFQKRSKRMVTDQGDEQIDPTSPGPEQQALVAAMKPHLAKCLGRLTPKARRVLELRFGLELTTQRIGELLGGSKQYIGRVIKRSLELLRECLEGGSPSSSVDVRHLEDEPHER